MIASFGFGDQVNTLSTSLDADQAGNTALHHGARWGDVSSIPQLVELNRTTAKKCRFFKRDEIHNSRFHPIKTSPSINCSCNFSIPLFDPCAAAFLAEYSLQSSFGGIDLYIIHSKMDIALLARVAKTHLLMKELMDLF